MKKEEELIIIGRSDVVDLPKLGLYNIEAKIDTGAFTSAIHCHNIREIKTKKGTAIAFNLLDPSHSEYNEKEFILKKYNKKTVKSSIGHAENRYVVKTKIRLFDKTYSIELSLTDRKDMKFPILIGRKLLMNKFIVDVSKVNVSANLNKCKM